MGDERKDSNFLFFVEQPLVTRLDALLPVGRLVSLHLKNLKLQTRTRQNRNE